MGNGLVSPKIRNSVLLNSGSAEIDGDISVCVYDPKKGSLPPVEKEKTGSKEQPSISGNRGGVFDEVDEVHTYGQIRAKNIRLRGSWLGFVSGSTDINSQEFARNTQIFIKASKMSHINIMLEQSEVLFENVNAKIYVFRGREGITIPCTKFLERDITFESSLSMYTQNHSIVFKKSIYPYIIVCTHSRIKEAGFELHLESDTEVDIQVPKDFCEFFHKPKENLLIIEGEWKGKTAGGPPPPSVLYPQTENLRRVQENRKNSISGSQRISTSSGFDNRPSESGKETAQKIENETNEKEEMVDLGKEDSSELRKSLPHQMNSFSDNLVRKIHLPKLKRGRKKRKKGAKAHWMANPSFPLIARKVTRCYVILRRDCDEPVSMGLIVLKSSKLKEGNESDVDGRKKGARSRTKYIHENIDFNSVVARHGVTGLVSEVHFRVLLLANEEPYLFLPFCEEKGKSGKFVLEIYSDVPVYKLKHDKVEKKIELNGMWMERTCGGRPDAKDTNFFNSPQFFLTITYAKDSPFKPEDGRRIYAQLQIEQLAAVGEHMPIGFCLVKSGEQVTKANWNVDKVSQDKIPQYKRIVSAELRLIDGQPYTIIPYPKVHNYIRDCHFMIRIKTHLPSDTNISFVKSPMNDKLFTNLDEFFDFIVKGEWKLLSSGGGCPIQDPTFFRNPQFNVVVKSKTKMHIRLTRTTEHWQPMGLYIVQLFGITEKRISFLENLERKGDGSIIQKVEGKHTIIDSAQFTNGVPKTLEKNVILPCGNYVIIVCSQIKGLEGSFMLTLKTHKRVRILPFDQDNAHKEVLESGFIGGLCTLYPNHEYFGNNPTFGLTIQAQKEDKNKVQDFIAVIEQPPGQHVLMCIYVRDKKTNEMIVQSAVSNSTSIRCTSTLSPGDYDIIIGIAKGKEGKFSLTVETSPQQPKFKGDIEIETPSYFLFTRKKNVISYFEKESLKFASQKIQVICEGICGPSNELEKIKTNYPEYKGGFFNSLVKAVAKETTRIMVVISGGKANQELGFILRTGKGEVQRYENTVGENIFSRRIVLGKGDNIFEIYPLEVGSKIESFFTIFSDKEIQVEEVTKKQVLLKFTGMWNLERTPSHKFTSFRFFFNNIWEINSEENSIICAKVNRKSEMEERFVGVNLKKLKDQEFDGIGTSISHFEEPEMDYVDLKLFLVVLHNPKYSSISDYKVINKEDIYEVSKWKNRKNFLMTVLKKSDKPYFLAVTSTNLKTDNTFNMDLFSDRSIKVKNLNRIYKKIKFSRLNKFETTQTLSLRGSFCDSNWKNNFMVKFLVKKGSFFQIKITNPLESHQKMGLAVIQPTGDIFDEVFENNKVFAEEKMDYTNEIIKYTYLEESEKPYYIVPLTKIGSNDEVDIVVNSEQKTEFEIINTKEEKVGNVVKLLGGFNYGVMGGSSMEEHENTFKKNPFLEFTLDKDSDCIFKIDSKLLIYMELHFVDVKNGKSFKRKLNFEGIVKVNLEGGVLYRVIVSVALIGVEGLFDLTFNHFSKIDIKKIHGMIGEEEKEINYNYYLKGKWDPMINNSHIDLNESNLEQKYEDLMQNSRILIEIEKPNIYLHLKLIVKSIKGMSPLQSSRILIIEKESKNIVYCPKTIPFSTGVDAEVFLQKGNYFIIPLLQPKEGKGDSEENISIEFSFSIFSPIELFFETNWKNSQSEMKETFPECDFYTFEIYNLLNNVKSVTTTKSITGKNDRIAPSPLVVFGNDVFPIMTGISDNTSLFKYSSENKEKLAFFREKFGPIFSKSLETPFLDVKMPFAAAGSYGKGKIVVIGDTQIFHQNNIKKTDNRTLLLNCIDFVLKKSFQNVDIIPGSLGGGIKRRKSLGELNKLAEDAKANSPLLVQNSPREKKYNIVQYFVQSGDNQLVPSGDILKAECRVNEMKNIEKSIDLDTNAFFLVFDEDSRMETKELDLILNKISENGCGAIILSKCSKGCGRIIPETGSVKAYPANYILRNAGIVIAHGNVVQNNEYDFSKFFWISEKDKKTTLRRDKKIANEYMFMTEKSEKVLRFHANLALEQFKFLTQNHSNLDFSNTAYKVTASNEDHYREILQVYSVLEMLCLYVPEKDKTIFPKLLKSFYDNKNKGYLFSSSLPPGVSGLSKRKFHTAGGELGLSYLLFSQRLSLALLTNLFSNSKSFAIEKKIEKGEKEVNEITFGDDDDMRKYCLTGVYARPGEIVVVEILEEWNGEKKKKDEEINDEKSLEEEVVKNIDFGSVCIGNYTQNLLLLRSFELNSFPKRSNVFDTQGMKKREVWNKFGGLIYCKGIKSCRIIGGKKIGTKKLELESGNENPHLVLWKGENLSLTLPKKDALVGGEIVDKLSKAIRILNELTGDDKKKVLFFEQQLPFKSPCSFENVVCFTEKTFWDNLNNNNYNSIIREFSCEIHKGRSYVWNGRLDALTNVTVCYVLEKITHTSFKEEKFYKELRESNQKDKTLFELILIEEFGWESYIKALNMGGSSIYMSNKDKVEEWLVNFSNEVKRDISTYFEIFGYTISQATKNRIKGYQKWVPLELV